MTRHAFLLLALGACTPHFRTELRGGGAATIGAPAGPSGTAVAATGNAFVLHYRVGLPRAAEVAVAIACPDLAVTRVVGETMAAYRTRRLAELAAERQREVQAVGSVTGAVLGQAGATAELRGPAGQAQVSATVDGQAAGASAAEAALPEPELPPGDTGARVEQGSARFVPSAAGTCQMTLSSPTSEDLTGVRGDFWLEEEVDLDAARRARDQALATRAASVRASLTASLVARGADPELRQRERDAEQARLEARRQADAARAASGREAELAAQRARDDAANHAAYLRQLRWETEQAALAQRVHLRLAAAVELRGRLRTWLIATGADPDLQGRLAAEAQAEQQRRLLLVAQRRDAAFALRARWLAYLEATGADPGLRQRKAAAAQLAADQRAADERAANEAELRAADEREATRAAEAAELAARVEADGRAALTLRADVKGWLLAAGAFDRPPRPAPEVEERPPAPEPSSAWIAGEYAWDGATWVWRAGYWTAPPAPGVVWLPTADVVIEGRVVVRPGVWVDRGGKPVRRAARPGIEIHDHRR